MCVCVCVCVHRLVSCILQYPFLLFQKRTQLSVRATRTMTAVPGPHVTTTIHGLFTITASAFVSTPRHSSDRWGITVVRMKLPFLIILAIRYTVLQRVKHDWIYFRMQGFTAVLP